MKTIPTIHLLIRLNSITVAIMMINVMFLKFAGTASLICSYARLTCLCRVHHDAQTCW